MGFEIKGVSPLSTNVGHLSMLLYGQSGNGKTSLAATMPGKVAYLLTEPQGSLVVKDVMLESGRTEGDVQIFFIEDQRDKTGELFKDDKGRNITAEVYLDLVLTKLERTPGDFSAVVLDSLTDMQQRLKDRIEASKAGKPLAIQEWGKIVDYTRRLSKRLRNLRMHTCIITLATEVQDESNQMVVRPSLIGKKLPADIQQYFNIVGFVDKEWQRDGGERYFVRMQSSADKMNTKGHRALKAEEVPDIGVWLDKISAYWEERAQSPLPKKAEITVEDKGPELSPEEKSLRERLDNPKLKELFDRLGTSEENKMAGLKKFRNDDKLIEVLEARLTKRLAEEGAAAAVEESAP